jgi:hypothetical protein
MKSLNGSQPRETLASLSQQIQKLIDDSAPTARMRTLSERRGDQIFAQIVVSVRVPADIDDTPDG